MDIYSKILRRFDINVESNDIDPLNILGPTTSLKISQDETLTEVEMNKVRRLNNKIWKHIEYIITRNFTKGDIYLAHLHVDNILKTWLNKDDVQTYLWGKGSLLEGPSYFWNSNHELLRYQTQSDIIELPPFSGEDGEVRVRNILMMKHPDRIEEYDKMLYGKIDLLPEEVRYIFRDEVTKEYILRILEYPQYLRQTSLDEFRPFFT